MNRLWRQLGIATNWPVLAAVGVLSAMGIVSIWADNPGDGAKQIVFLMLGVLVMGASQTVSYLRIGRWTWGFYLLGLGLVFYTVLAAKMGGLPLVHDINGAYAWINLGTFSVQPAELTKIAFILVLARYLRFRSNYRTLLGLVPPFLLAMFPIGLILLQPDLGTALTFIPALFAMLFVAGARIKHLLIIIGVGLAIAPVLWYSGTCSRAGCTICPNVPGLRALPQFVKHYQRARVYAMTSNDPKVLQEAGYQQERALIAMGSGGTSGKGAGNIPLGKHVPESHNDMIFALIGEQFGFLGSLVVIAAYLVLFVTGVEIAAGTREPFGRLVAMGIVAILAGQTFLNLTVAIRLMPVTGVTLPFVSYGGSSLLASFFAAGLLLNVGQNRPIVMAKNSFEYD